MSGITRRSLLGLAGTGSLGLMLGCRAAGSGADAHRPPNIITILADDLGWGELGCYGQQRIRTPRIDRLAAEGMRFTQFYAGSAVCAPSRCTLLTGRHTGHAHIRDNGRPQGTPEGQAPLPADAGGLAGLLREAGYATGCVGKWGLGYPGSSGEPLAQGFDFFYGYNCQTHAHNYYPRYLWRNRDKVPQPGNDRGVTGRTYAPDRMIEEALGFIEGNRDRPFFLYFATPVPHVSLQVPADSLREYAGAFPETPFKGSRSYTPHPTPRAAYAAMITRLDRDVGRIVDAVERLGLSGETLILFTSDNGPTWTGGVDHRWFSSTGGLRGRKGQLTEGGIRVPLVARWPGRVPAGRVDGRVGANWDLYPTILEAAGVRAPGGRDGVSLLPTLLGRGGGERPGHLYWELRGQQAVRAGRWKALRPRGARRLALYDLVADPREQRDLAAEHPEVAARMRALMARRKPSWKRRWNFRPLPAGPPPPRSGGG